MKRFGIFAAAILIPAAVLADTISSPGAGFVGVPLTFSSTTGSSGGAGAPFWNNNSSDGLNLNAGYFLTGSNAAMGLTNYLGTGGAFGSYYPQAASGRTQRTTSTSFRMVRRWTSRCSIATRAPI